MSSDLRYDLNDALDALQGMVANACTLPDRTLSPMGSATNLDALDVLRRFNRIVVTAYDTNGNILTARWRSAEEKTR